MKDLKVWTRYGQPTRLLSEWLAQRRGHRIVGTWKEEEPGRGDLRFLDVTAHEADPVAHRIAAQMPAARRGAIPVPYGADYSVCSICYVSKRQGLALLRRFGIEVHS